MERRPSQLTGGIGVATFRGIIEVEGEPDSAVITDIEVVKGVIELRAGGQSLGSWNLNDITIVPADDYYRIEAEDGALRLRIRDAKRFSATVGVGLPDREATALDDLTPAVTPAPPPGPTETLRQAAAAAEEARSDQEPEEEAEKPPGPDESSLARPYALALGAAAAALVVGAVLDWGPWRLVGGRFPVARLILGLSGVAVGAAAYLALAGEKRRDVGLVASLGVVIAITIMLIYTLDSPMGLGFVLAVLATAGAVTMSVLTFLPQSAAPKRDDEEPRLIR